MGRKRTKIYTSPILEGFFKPYEKMRLREKVRYLETANEMLKKALEVADKNNLLNKADVKRRGCGCKSGYDEKGNIECCVKCYIFLGAM